MKIVTKTATQARNQFFDLILAAKYGGQVTIVTKNGEPAAKLVPIIQDVIDWKKYKKAIKGAGGIFTDDDVKQVRQVRIDSRTSKYPDW